MIGTEFLPGQGLGNRLFCYVTARAAAARAGAAFCTAGWEYMNADFLALDPGVQVGDPKALHRYDEADRRLYLKTCAHDMVHGCFVADADPGILTVEDNTLLYGNLQAEAYFAPYRKELSEWLRVREEYESDEFTRDDLCIINVRGGEYAGEDALFLPQRYYVRAMRHMQRLYGPLRFMVVTDDEETAGKLLPGIPAHHFSPAKDYVTLKNARYLILSNSSFGVFPALTSEVVRKVIAPKYWARYNVSDGYWSSPQNIYTGFDYLGRDGKLCSGDQCRAELAAYVYPETEPWEAQDPEVARVRRKERRRVLYKKALRKVRRVFR